MSESKSSLGDIPSKQNWVFINGTLDEKSQAFLLNLGNILEVTIDFMLDHIVPNSGINIERTMQNLRQEGVLLDAGWEVFKNALPKKSPDNEQKMFLKMGTIYQKIVASTEFDVGHSRTPTLILGTSPYIVPVSETSVRSRPDGCGQLNTSHPIHTSQWGYPSHSRDKGEYHWFNIAYVEGYKKRNTRSDLNNVCLFFILKLTSLSLLYRTY